MAREVTDIYLSLVIPAYNEAHRIRHTLECVYKFLGTQDYSYEVVLCNDGSNDSTGSIAKAFLDEKSNFQLLNLPHKGKGSAVKAGMIAARGQNIFMCDADLAMPLDQINLFLDEMAKGYDYFSLTGINVSPDNTKVIYAIDINSRRKYSMYVKDLITKKSLNII